MLTNKTKHPRPSRKLTRHKTMSVKATIYQFPNIAGLEDVASKMNAVKAETLFSALLKGFNLSTIMTEDQAKKAERFLEYLLRAFDRTCPSEVKIYLHLLEMIIKEYDEQHTFLEIKNIPPHKLLRASLNKRSN